jgi:hypothetical protein
MHVRVAREGARRRLILVAAALGALAGLAAACTRPPSSVALTVTLDPATPVAGAATTARISLQTPDRRPLAAANLRVDAHMTHPGMAPVPADVVRVGEGEYETRIEFSMAGDWLLVVTGELPDGERFTREFAVAGVRSDTR